MKTTKLLNRITDYLALGGLFNPEFANHFKVRDLLIECREALVECKALRSHEIERRWEVRYHYPQVIDIYGITSSAFKGPWYPVTEPEAERVRKLGGCDIRSWVIE